MTERKQLLVCMGSACLSAKARGISELLKEELKRRNLDSQYRVIETGCIGSCELGPKIIVSPEEIFYIGLKPEDVKEIVNRHFVNGQIVEWLLYRDPGTGERKTTLNEISFFKNQIKIALRNCGYINPVSIEDYLAKGGYQALTKVLHTLTPERVIETVKAAGLRGRGGGGFPTGIKWEMTRKAEPESPDRTKYVICNGDEGDPGAFMDRSIMEGDPHSIIEAMTIAGYAIGSRKGYIYVRAEYALAVERLEAAIEVAQRYGALGTGIFDSQFDFDIEIRIGAGAFVCGEETALINSVQGNRGEPRPKPPFPAEKGLWSQPTVINNVETFANIPVIILRGSDWFRRYGTGNSPGTKVFSLTGDINNTGLIEVPMGTTLRSIIYELGGGIPGGRKFKAAQIGGPSGGVLTEAHLDIPLDFDSLKEIGAMVGSGGLVIMDEASCMVDIAKFYLDFTQDESCGKCTPCRIGTRRMLEILRRITAGEGKEEDLSELVELSELIRNTSICGLGLTAPNPVLSTLHYFREEYEQHILDRYCAAGICDIKPRYRIDPETCTGCGLCARVCPAGVIKGEKRKPHEIDSNACKQCGICYEKCPMGAIWGGNRKEEAVMKGGV